MWDGREEEEEEVVAVALAVGRRGLVALFQQGFFGSPSCCRLSEQDESGADEVTARRRDPPSIGNASADNAPHAKVKIIASN